MNLLRQLGTMGAARGVEALVQAALLILLARELGPTLFGLVAVYHAVHSVTFIVTGMNTATFVVREEALGQRGLAYGALKTNALVLTCALVLILPASLLVLHHPFIAVAVAANTIGTWAQQLSDNRLSLPLAHRVVWIPFVTTVGRSISSLVVFLACLVFGVDAALAFAIARLTATVLSLTLAAGLVRLDRSTRPASMRTVFKLQLPLTITAAAASFRNLDAVIVVGIAGLAAGGLYSAATRIVTPFGLLAPALNPVLVPRMATAPARGAIRVLDILLGILLLASILPLALWPHAERLVLFVFGEDYVGGGAVLVWVLFRLGPTLVGGLVAGVLQSRKLDARVAVNYVTVTAGTLVSCLFGSFLAGPVGAALGVAAVAVAGSLHMWFSGRRALKALD